VRTKDTRGRGRLAACPGSGTSVSQDGDGGKRHTRRLLCPVCGKSIALTETGRLRPHGTRRI
jgi:hypothetical protein